ncbi:MAG: hypothetical protein QOE55_6332 [Acidobacteriaceae bacterium]|jgi:hypothetical protein|nr:hypothetical protein [Acidobacteriaceae bacterium]
MALRDVGQPEFSLIWRQPIDDLGSLHSSLDRLASQRLSVQNGNHADRRVSSGLRPGFEVHVLSTTSRSVG